MDPRSAEDPVTELYIYDPLPEGCIRLLEITSLTPNDSSLPSRSPAAGNGFSWTCQIIQLVLKDSDNTPFEAISYVWGNPKRNKSLVLSNNKRLPITDSVQKALEFLVEAQQTTRIWIDQLCIDQENVVERSHQVQIMGSIYARAKCVIVWLGEEPGTFKYAKTVFEKFEKCEATIRTWGDEPACYERDALLESLLINTRDSSNYRSAILDVMKLPWFERAWVFQEFALSNRACMLLGGFKFDPWTLFYITCRMRNMSQERDTIFQNHEISYLRLNHPFQVMFNFKTNQEDLCFFLSRMADRCKVFDQRDLVYAFSSLNPDPRIKIEPDYTLSVRNVFINTARSIIAATQALDLLAAARRDENSDWRTKQSWTDAPPKTPSWVPNWCYRASGVPLFNPKGRTPFRSSKRRPYIPFESVHRRNTDRLVVRGKVFTKVHAISQVPTGLGSRRPIQAYVRLDEQRSVLQSLISSLQSTPTEAESISSDFNPNTLKRSRLLRLMIADAAFVPPLSEPMMDEDKDFRPDGVLYDTHISRLLEIYDGQSRGEDELWQRDLRLLSEYVLVLRRRNVFVALDGKLGLGMKSMRLGDDIALIHGSSTPLILRQKSVEDGAKLYEVIGQCYLEDAMYGEACIWDEFNADEITLI